MLTIYHVILPFITIRLKCVICCISFGVLNNNFSSLLFLKTITIMRTTKLSPTAAKYKAIIESGKISESEIISMKSFMGKSSDNARFIFDLLNELPDGLQLSDSQNKKGIDFLLSQWKTPMGKERVNNPFGYREQNVLENFLYFTIDSFYDCSNYDQMAWYLPIYHCVSNDGSQFEYYYNGKVQIIR